MSKEIKVSVGLTFKCEDFVSEAELLNRYFRGVKRSLEGSVGDMVGIIEWVRTDLRLDDKVVPHTK